MFLSLTYSPDRLLSAWPQQRQPISSMFLNNDRTNVTWYMSSCFLEYKCRPFSGSVLWRRHRPGACWGPVCWLLSLWCLQVHLLAEEMKQHICAASSSLAEWTILEALLLETHTIKCHLIWSVQCAMWSSGGLKVREAGLWADRSILTQSWWGQWKSRTPNHGPVPVERLSGQLIRLWLYWTSSKCECVELWVWTGHYWKRKHWFFNGYIKVKNDCCWTEVTINRSSKKLLVSYCLNELNAH